MLALLTMWFGISFPLVFLGFYFGFRKQPYEHPVRTNQIPRQIPDQVWYLTPVARYVYVCMCTYPLRVRCVVTAKCIICILIQYVAIYC